MEKISKYKAFLSSLSDVGRFIILIFVMSIVVILFLFSVKFDFKNYDIVLSSRLHSDIYYGIEYSPAFEIWKIYRAKDGSLYTRRIYPH